MLVAEHYVAWGSATAHSHTIHRSPHHEMGSLQREANWRSVVPGTGSLRKGRLTTF